MVRRTATIPGQGAGRGLTEGSIKKVIKGQEKEERSRRDRSDSRDRSGPLEGTGDPPGGTGTDSTLRTNGPPGEIRGEAKDVTLAEVEVGCC